MIGFSLLKVVQMKIFNGLTSERADKSVVKAPGNADYWALVKEIAETQEFVTNLSNNMSIMPDLEGILQESQNKLVELQSQLEKLAVPEDVMARLEELEKSHLELDSRAYVAQLAHKNEQTKAELQKSQLQVAKMQEEFIKEVRSLQNKTWGALNDLTTEVQTRLKNLETKVERLETATELQSLLTKLK
jgi:chromosome segregation ATPase